MATNVSTENLKTYIDHAVALMIAAQDVRRDLNEWDNETGGELGANGIRAPYLQKAGGDAKKLNDLWGEMAAIIAAQQYIDFVLSVAVAAGTATATGGYWYQLRTAYGIVEFKFNNDRVSDTRLSRSLYNDDGR
jgi:hypothetical protein